MCRSNAQPKTLPAVIQSKTYRTSNARFRSMHVSFKLKILLPMYINTKFLFCNYQQFVLVENNCEEREQHSSSCN